MSAALLSALVASAPLSASRHSVSGDRDGAGVGGKDGFPVSRAARVGAMVGAAEGRTVGAALGLRVGAVVGPAVGTAVGVNVGNTVGA